MTDPTRIDITTPDGVAPAWVHRPDDGAHPGVLFYPDAGSARDATHAMAARFASLGYVVLMPEIFYREGDWAPFDMATVWGDEAERARIFKMIRGLDAASAMRDAAAYLDALAALPGVVAGPAGCVGYCIGGRLAFTTAGTYPERIAAAASIHGGGIATDAEDSPHRAADRVRARLYFGIADEDGSCTPEQQGMLVAALAGAHVRFTVDLFAGARHGFAVPDFPVFDAAAAETHYARVGELFAEALAR